MTGTGYLLWVNGHVADRGPADAGRDFANKVGKRHFYAASNRRFYNVRELTPFSSQERICWR